MDHLFARRPAALLMALTAGAVLGGVSLCGAAAGVGNSALKSQLQREVLALQLAEQQVQELPHNLKARSTEVFDPAQVAARTSLLHDVYAADVADEQAADYQRSLTLVARDTTYLPYQHVRVVLKDWESVRMFGNHAWVQFVSQFEYSGNGQHGKLDVPAPIRWTMSLVRQGESPFGGWRVESEIGLPLRAP